MENNTETANSGGTSVFFKQDTPLTPQGPGLDVRIDPSFYTEEKAVFDSITWNPKHYKNCGFTLKWGKDISSGDMDLLRKGEVFTLLDKKGNPYSIVLMDSYNQIREGKLK